MKLRTYLHLALSTAALWAATQQPAFAQISTAKQTLKIVVATPPGGASDTAARILAQSLSKNLGYPVVVENKPGGNGIPAIQTVLAAPADGQTLLWAMSSMTGMPQLVKSSPVKSMAEFTPVVPVVNLMYGIFVNPKVPATTVAELTAYLKANPDRVNYGTGVLSEYLITMHYLHGAGVRAARIPYKGGAQVMPDLMSGELQFNIGPLAPGLPHVKSGKLRLLATLPDRGEVVGGVPSLADSGIATEALPTWNGLLAPPGTPPGVAARLAEDVNRALDDPALRSSLEAQGFRVTGGKPQQMSAAIESATTVWRDFVREYNIPQEQ